MDIADIESLTFCSQGFTSPERESTSNLKNTLVVSNSHSLKQHQQVGWLPEGSWGLC